MEYRQKEAESRTNKLVFWKANCIRRRRTLTNFVGVLWTLAKALRVFWAFYRAGSYDVTFSLRKGFCPVQHKILSSSRTSGVGGRIVEEFRSCCSFFYLICPRTRSPRLWDVNCGNSCNTFDVYFNSSNCDKKGQSYPVEYYLESVEEYSEGKIHMSEPESGKGNVNTV